jgi:Nucleotidyltransferase domain.
MNWDLYNAQLWKKRTEALKNARAFVVKIKRECEKIDPKCKVILFGSIAKGDWRCDSDVDVLIITDCVKNAFDRAIISTKLHKALGVWEPFEIHVVTRKEYEEWYKRFIDVYEEF